MLLNIFNKISTYLVNLGCIVDEIQANDFSVGINGYVLFYFNNIYYEIDFDTVYYLVEHSCSIDEILDSAILFKE